jgi:hypothetical protein
MKTFLVSVLVCLFVCSGLAQNFAPPENNSSTNQLSTWLDLKWNTNNAVFHAPATIDIFAYVELRQTELRAGDVVKVEFFSGMNHIGSGKAIWHDEVRPKEIPGQFTPMHILAAQFDPAEYIWKKVPAGTYTLTAKATWKNLSATSAPMNATVLSQ